MAVDILRSELYRILDDLSRARLDQHGALIIEFERAWTSFKDETGKER